MSTLNLGPSLLFDGATQEVTIPDSSAYSQPTTGALTILIWARPDVDPMPNNVSTGYVNFFSKDETSSQHEWCFRWYNTSNTETNLRGNEQDFYIFNAVGGIGVSPIAQQSQNYLGNWICYVATVDANYATLYLNGDIHSGFAGRALYSGTITPTDTTAILRVGHSASSASYFKGAIGPIKIWDRVLSPNEIMRQVTTNESNTTGLVGSWTADQANNRLTDSVSANHGTLVNNPTFITGLVTNRKKVGITPRPQPYSGQALVLNGSTQYASIAKATQVGLDVGTGDFMICAKVKIGAKGKSQTFFDMHDTSHANPNTSGATGWSLIYNSNGNLQVQFGDGSTTGSSNGPSVRLFDNEFHNIAIVSARNFGTGVTSLWIDGIKISNNSGGLTGSWTSNGDLRIGTREDHTTQFLNGAIANVHFYTWTTIPSDHFHAIEDLHYKGFTSYTTGLVSKWLFNGTATDSVGPNNLTLTGSPTYGAVQPVRNVA